MQTCVILWKNLKIVQNVQNCANCAKLCKTCKSVQNWVKLGRLGKIGQTLSNCAKCEKLCKIYKIVIIVQNVQNCASCANRVTRATRLTRSIAYSWKYDHSRTHWPDLPVEMLAHLKRFRKIALKKWVSSAHCVVYESMRVIWQSWFSNNNKMTMAMITMIMVVTI